MNPTNIQYSGRPIATEFDGLSVSDQRQTHTVLDGFPVSTWYFSVGYWGQAGTMTLNPAMLHANGNGYFNAAEKTALFTRQAGNVKDFIIRFADDKIGQQIVETPLEKLILRSDSNKPRYGDMC